MSSHKFLVHADDDSVGVAVEDFKAGETVIGIIMDPDHEITVKSNHDIPLGHKIALKDAKAGDFIIKYGEKIGKATMDIKVGDWVHTHNLKSARW
ncbi:UxaA family hydrolase [Desulfosporosinus sp. SB140]|uniref:UxaA family hydrolase n=1 Tax=Desulfosporosinus paludis TaxID=3115649 RepID=UPI0038908935